MSGEASDPTFLLGALLTILESSDEGVIVLDASGRCRLMGRRAGALFGLEPSACVGRPGAEVLAACAKACDDPDAFLRAATAPQTSRTIEADVEVREPVARTVACRAVWMGVDGHGSGRVILVREVILERSAETSTPHLRARLRAVTPFDSLTGLLNQRRLYEELGREHSRSTRAWDSYALLRVGVDSIGEINAEFGMSAGDQILEQVARRLEACVREYDVLARIEGDEFGVLLPGADAVAARTVAERMMRGVAGVTFALEGEASSASAVYGGTDGPPLQFGEPILPAERTVTISVGVALWVPPARDSAEGVFRRAGEALREACRRGAGTLSMLGA